MARTFFRAIKKESHGSATLAKNIFRHSITRMKEFRKMSNVKQKKVVQELSKVLNDLGFENHIVAISTDQGEAQDAAICGGSFALAHLMIALQDEMPEEVKAHMLQHVLGNLFERILEKEGEDEL